MSALVILISLQLAMSVASVKSNVFQLFDKRGTGIRSLDFNPLDMAQSLNPFSAQRSLSSDSDDQSQHRSAGALPSFRLMDFINMAEVVSRVMGGLLTDSPNHVQISRALGEFGSNRSKRVQDMAEAVLKELRKSEQKSAPVSLPLQVIPSPLQALEGAPQWFKNNDNAANNNNNNMRSQQPQPSPVNPPVPVYNYADEYV